MHPKDFTYKLPEDYEFKPEHRAKIDAVMEKLGADNETAQELIDIHVEIVEDFATGLQAQLQSGYQSELNLDPKGD